MTDQAIPTAETADAPPLHTTALHALHLELGAKMVPFAGYDMPVQYPDGVLNEHLHTRKAAGLFDVSHMGQAWLTGPDHETTAKALETLVPGDLLNLKPGQMRYTLLLNAQGGILDDLMVTRPAEPELAGSLFLVVNAACKVQDFFHVEQNMPADVTLTELPDRALLALQGPEAAQVLAGLYSSGEALGFMRGSFSGDLSGPYITRSGYTGEDGFEISLPADEADAVARKLLSQGVVKPIGLGARDSLRLEAGLCLYGHDIDETTTPVEADLSWTLSKRRREEKNFPGAETICAQLEAGPSRLRVGLVPDGKAPAREGTEIAGPSQEILGSVTSGGYGPTVGGPVAMGYVTREFAEPGTALSLLVRGKPRPARVVSMPFVQKRFKK